MRGRVIAFVAVRVYRTDWDRRSACFDRLSMRFFSMPRRFYLILSLSKDAPRLCIPANRFEMQAA
jgi:hypothetical protein